MNLFSHTYDSVEQNSQKMKKKQMVLLQMSG